MVFSDSRWHYCSNTGISTGLYIYICQGGLIDHCKHVTCTFSQYGSDSDYNASCTTVMALSNFRILNIELLNKDLYVVLEQAPFIILDRLLAICMDKHGKDTKQTRQIPRRIYFVGNGEDYNLYKTVCCKGGIQLAYIGNKDVREDELKTTLGYALVRLKN